MLGEGQNQYHHCCQFTALTGMVVFRGNKQWHELFSCHVNIVYKMFRLRILHQNLANDKNYKIILKFFIVLIEETTVKQQCVRLGNCSPAINQTVIDTAGGGVKASNN